MWPLWRSLWKHWPPMRRLCSGICWTAALSMRPASLMNISREWLRYPHVLRRVQRPPGGCKVDPAGGAALSKRASPRGFRALQALPLRGDCFSPEQHGGTSQTACPTWNCAGGSCSPISTPLPSFAQRMPRRSSNRFSRKGKACSVILPLEP